MATLDRETPVEAIPVLTPEETDRFDQILAAPIDPVGDETMALYAAALTLHAD